MYDILDKRLDPESPIKLMGKLRVAYEKENIDDVAYYGSLRISVNARLDLLLFVMYQAAKDYKHRKVVFKDLHGSTKAFRNAGARIKECFDYSYSYGNRGAASNFKKRTRVGDMRLNVRSKQVEKVVQTC